MEKTWRWFGPNDPITLEMLRQIGVEGIVTALHSVPLGQVWSREAIREMREFIESRGLRWSVVESLPVTETIKYGGPDRDLQIEIYKESLRNLGKEGVRTVCYNFMPILDWARTDLEYPNPDGTSNLYFNNAEFAYFDINILQREGARNDYPTDVINRMEAMGRLTPEKEQQLIENIIIKFRDLLKLYEGIDKEHLRANMKYFLEAIMPVCDEYGINMCVHPDDPPQACARTASHSDMR